VSCVLRGNHIVKVVENRPSTELYLRLATFVFGAYSCLFYCICNSTSSLYYYLYQRGLTNILLIILASVLIELFWFYKHWKAKHEIKRKYTARDEMIWVVKIPSEWAKKHLDSVCMCVYISWRAFSFASVIRCYPSRGLINCDY